MPEQTFTGDRLWDEIIKAIIFVMPKQLFPLIKEIYGKIYPPDTPVRFISTEQSNYLNNPGNILSSKFMDISLVIADTDYYHIECQMKNDKLMVIRMISYDLHYAIEHCISKDHASDELVIRFPNSFVIYPEQNNSIPDSLRCRVIFQDDSEHVYQIPAVKVQTYSLEEIHEKHLNLFIPYLLLRLRPRLASKKNPLTKKELTAFLDEIIVMLQEDLSNGYLTRMECNDYVNLLVKASGHIFNRHPEYHEEVQLMTKPLIYLPSMQFKDMEAKLEELNTMLAEHESAIANQEKTMAEQKKAIAEKDSEIASLRAQLAALSH